MKKNTTQNNNNNNSNNNKIQGLSHRSLTAAAPLSLLGLEGSNNPNSSKLAKLAHIVPSTKITLD